MGLDMSGHLLIDRQGGIYMQMEASTNRWSHLFVERRGMVQQELAVTQGEGILKRTPLSKFVVQRGGKYE
jgi:hypothetical protein